MSEHEVWNELGNLYFVTGKLEQAAYAYSRSIKSQNRYGLPYSNLAHIKAEQGKLSEAVDLYRQSVDLLCETRDKAISLYRLGDALRRLNKYQDAIMAYQQADLLDIDVSKELEAPQMFLYGPSNIPMDVIPSLLRYVSKPKIDGADGDTDEDPAAAGEEVACLKLDGVTGDTVEDMPDGGAQESIGAFPEEYPFGEEKEGLPFMEEAEESDAAFFHEEELLYQNMEIDSSHEDLTAPMDYDEHGDYILKNADSITIEYLDALTPVNGEYPESTQRIGAREQNNLFADVDVLTEEVGGNMVCLYIAEEEETASETGEGVALERTELESPIAEAMPEEVSKNTNELISKLEQDLNKTPRSARRWNELASMYKSACMYDQAIIANQRAVKLDPDSTIYMYELGVLYGFAGRHEESIDCMQRVLEMNPDHSLANASLSGYYRKMGLEELADQHIGAAMRNYIDDENQYNRACLEALQGNVSGAVELLRKALEAQQIYVEWVLRDPDLDAIRYSPQFKELVAEFAHR